MNINDIIDAPDLTVSQKISQLQVKNIVVPSWDKLRKEYDPKQHPVCKDPKYHEKNGSGQLSRVTLGWQKLATKRMAALMFGIQVKRVYATTDNEQEKLAQKIMEDIYSRNRINSVNLERAEWLYAACEVVTIWYTQETPAVYAGQSTGMKLRCRSFAPNKGCGLFPLFDEYDDLVALSIRYTRTDEERKNVTYFDTYTADRHICFNETKQEVIMDENITVGKIAGIYMHRDEPIWEDESNNVYEAEWTLSRNGNYVRKNSRPKLAIYSDSKVVADRGPKGENVSSEVIRLGKGDKMEFVSWNGSIEATKFHVDQLKQNFNGQLQLPDVSMDNMKSTPMSGESRKMLFMDSQMKVTRESGIWLEGFDREFNVIRAFAKIMFPGMASAFDTIRVRHIITPYQILDEKEDVEKLSTACGTIASTRTCVSRLGWVDDIDEEVRLIQEAETADVFNPME